MLRSNKKKNSDNFLLYVPVIKHTEWIEKENKVFLLFHYNRPIERLAAWLVRKPRTTDMKLDKLGSRVWKLIDGKKTVYDISQCLLNNYGDEYEPVYDRLTMYLRYINKKGWIRFEKGSQASKVDLY